MKSCLNVSEDGDIRSVYVAIPFANSSLGASPARYETVISCLDVSRYGNIRCVYVAVPFANSSLSVIDARSVPMKNCVGEDGDIHDVRVRYVLPAIATLRVRSFLSANATLCVLLLMADAGTGNRDDDKEARCAAYDAKDHLCLCVVRVVVVVLCRYICN